MAEASLRGQHCRHIPTSSAMYQLIKLELLGWIAQPSAVLANVERAQPQPKLPDHGAPVVAKVLLLPPLPRASRQIIDVSEGRLGGSRSSACSGSTHREHVSVASRTFPVAGGGRSLWLWCTTNSEPRCSAPHEQRRTFSPRGRLPRKRLSLTPNNFGNFSTGALALVRA